MPNYLAWTVNVECPELAKIRRNPHDWSPPHSGRPATCRASATALGHRSDACSGVGYRGKLPHCGHS
jgi:hypothetical protein